MSAGNPTYVRDRDLLEAELGNGLVALDVTDGLCFGFNDVAVSIWRHLAQPIPVTALVAAMREEYDVDQEECARDVRETLMMLEEHRPVKVI